MPNEILLYGEIGVDVTSTDVKTVLASMDTDEELVVRIDSPGGSVFQGFSIHEALAQYPGPKRAVVESVSMSIASYILTAFDDVTIARNGYVMIHNPNLSMEGDDEDFAKAASDLAKYKATMISDYAERTGKSQDEILEMMKAETYLNADEAIEMGFATSKTEPIPSRVVTARTKQMPMAVQRSLSCDEDASGDTYQTTEKQEMADTPKRVAATVREVKAIHPNAKAEFIVKCVEKEMTAEEVQQEAMEQLQSENDELKSKLKAMEDEQEKARAMEEEEEKAKAEEDEKAKAAEEEETKARARARGHQPVAVATRSGGASATAKWREAVDTCLERGMPRARAVQQASRANPGLREQYLQEVNAAAGRN